MSSSVTQTAMEKLFGNSLNAEGDAAPSNALVTLHESIKEEISRYNKTSVDINDDPLTWWGKHSGLFPHLSSYAKDRLTASGTSVPSERVFSKAGQLVNAKRACLSSKHVDEIIFLNKNLSGTAN